MNVGPKEENMIEMDLSARRVGNFKRCHGQQDIGNCKQKLYLLALMREHS
jgi:hypothetical protein